MGNVLLNPNNPTGALYPVDLLREILERAWAVSSSWVYIWLATA